MPKRLCDTLRHKEQWFRLLPPNYKCLWEHINAECDNAGFWRVDLGLAAFSIGCKETEFQDKQIEKVFGGKVMKITNEIWWITTFCPEQYTLLKPTSNVHISAFKLLLQFEFHKSVKSYLQNQPEIEQLRRVIKEKNVKNKDHNPSRTVGEGLANPSPTVKAKKKDKDKNTKNDKVLARQIPKNLTRKPKQWKKCMSMLKKIIERENFETWIKPTRYLGQKAGSLYIEVESEFNRSWIQRNFQNHITEQAKEQKLLNGSNKHNLVIVIAETKDNE